MTGRTAIARILLAALLLFGTFSALAQSAPAIEQRKIDYLIASVGQLQGAQFIRNGTAYDAGDAVDHLQMKRRYAGKHLHSADDFIRLCATGSSMSGKPYLIRFADGHVEPAAQWLRARLTAYRDAPVRPAPGSPATVPTR
ncbi:MAG TPA: DUF5329 domain-containing protein [Dyella sp.]|nr:DUF5329 domain-containing protein [Dyella sp.]